LGQDTFYFIARNPACGDAQYQIFYFSVRGLQAGPIDVGEKFHDRSCDPFIAIIDILST